MESIHGKRSVPSDWPVPGKDGQPLKKQENREARDFRKTINAILGARGTLGPYFPLQRRGDFVVAGERAQPKQSFTTREARDEAVKTAKAGDRTLQITTRTDKKSNTYEFTPVERIVQMFETESEAHEFAQRLVEDGFALSVGVQTREDFTSRGGALAGSELERALNKLPPGSKARTAALNFFLDMFPQTSLRQTLRHRKNILGADGNMSQVFGQYVYSSSNHIAQLQYGSKIGSVLSEMDAHLKAQSGTRGGRQYSRENERYLDEMRAIVSELSKRENEYKPTHEQDWDWVGKVNRFMFVQSLAQPGFVLVNMTQVPMITAPVLSAKHGIPETTNAMGSTLSMIMPDFMRRMGGTVGSLLKWKPERAFFEFLQVNENGDLSIGEEVTKNILESGSPYAMSMVQAVTDLGEMGKLDLTLSAVVHQAKTQSGTKLAREVNRFMELVRGPIQVVETFNRVWTGLTAYMLFRQQNTQAYQQNPELLHRDAVAYAAQIIDETQVNYSEADAPRYMSRSGWLGNFAPLIFMYKRYAHYMQMNFIRNFYRMLNAKDLSKEERITAAKTVGYLTATHVAAAGVLGLPQIGKVFASMAFMLLSGEDEPRSLDEWARAGMRDLFGEDAGEMLARGLPRALNVDLSANLGLDNAFLYTDQLRGKEGSELVGATLVALAGPFLGGYIGKLLTVPEFMENGQYWRAAELAAPKAFRNVSEAFRLSEEGITDRSGDVIRVPRDIGADELMMKLFGFSSASTAEFYAGRGAVQAAKAWYKQRRNALISRYRAGQRGPAFREAIEQFNASVPTPGLKITDKTLKDAIERGVKKGASPFGINLPSTQTGLEQYGDWANF